MKEDLLRNKEVEKAIEILENFHQLLDNYWNDNKPSDYRRQIMQQRHEVENIISRCGNMKSMTMTPPPAIGGYVMHNVNPFDFIFGAPYGLQNEIINCIKDMIDETISVINNDPKILQQEKKSTLKNNIIPSTNKIFIVHGHDNGIREIVARLLVQLGLDPIILQEQPNNGKTIIEKFEENSNVGFAIVLLTPDDIMSIPEKRNKSILFRARQNVIFEFGYFIGKLGRTHVAALLKDNIEVPSDLEGILYTKIDNAGAWKYKLATELQVAGYNVDKNKI